MVMPPERGKNCTSGVGHDIPGITGGAAHEVWPDDFKKDGPDDEMQRNLAGSRKVVARSEPKPALHQEQQRQCARHGQKVVKMKSQKCAVYVRFHEPAIDGIKRTAEKEQTVGQISETFHRSAMIAKPKTTATASLNKRIMP